MEQNNSNEFINREFVYAVIGVSRDKNKYGRKVFDDLKSNNFTVYPINPNINFIEKIQCFKSLKDLPNIPDVVIFVVPPVIGEKIIIECKELGINKIWLQPGSESQEIIDFCKKNNINYLHNQCIMLNR
jgi:hypothetical protein